MFETIKLTPAIELEHDEVCNHWTWRIGNREWSDCFDTKSEALSNAEQDLAWKLVYG